MRKSEKNRERLLQKRMSWASRRLREEYRITSAHPKWWTALPRADLRFTPPGSIPLSSGPTNFRQTSGNPHDPRASSSGEYCPRPRNGTVGSSVRPRRQTQPSEMDFSHRFRPRAISLRHARRLFARGRALTLSRRRSASSAFFLTAVGRPQPPSVS